MKYFITFKVENKLEWDVVCEQLYSKGYRWVRSTKLAYQEGDYISFCIKDGMNVSLSGGIEWIKNKIYTTCKSSFEYGERENYKLIDLKDIDNIGFIIESYKMNLL